MSIPIYSYPDEVTRKWKSERDSFEARVLELESELKRGKAHGTQLSESDAALAREKIFGSASFLHKELTAAREKIAGLIDALKQARHSGHAIPGICYACFAEKELAKWDVK